MKIGNLVIGRANTYAHKAAMVLRLWEDAVPTDADMVERVFHYAHSIELSKDGYTLLAQQILLIQGLLPKPVLDALVANLDRFSFSVAEELIDRMIHEKCVGQAARALGRIPGNGSFGKHNMHVLVIRVLSALVEEEGARPMRTGSESAAVSHLPELVQMTEKALGEQLDLSGSFGRIQPVLTDIVRYGDDVGDTPQIIGDQSKTLSLGS